MGKSLNGKELGKGLSQRKDGLYQGRFVNRFGKKQTVYAKTLNEVRQKLRNEQYEDEKALNVVAKDTFYYNLYVVAIDTGMRIGELMGLQWSDVDFEKKVVHVRRSLCYFRKDGKYVFEWHDTKTHNSKRTIPLTTRAMEALKKQRVRGQEILLNSTGRIKESGFRNQKQSTYTAVHRTGMYGCNNETNSEGTPGI